MNIPLTLRRKVIVIRRDNPMPGVHRLAEAIAANEQEQRDER